MWDLLPAVVVLVAMQASLILVDPDGGASAANLMWSLLPLVPFAWLVWAQVRAVRRADERQQLLLLSAMAVGFGATMLFAFAGGLLDAAGVGSAAQSLQITFIGGVLVWLGALAYLHRPAA